MMEDAFGVFGMTTEAFWSQTLPEWNARVRGHNRANASAGDAGGEGGGPPPLERSRLSELMEQYPDT